MRKMIFALITVVALSTAAASFAEEAPVVGNQKDECLLVSRGCMNQVDTIQQKIRRLDNEIKKGTRVYTPEELKKLEQALKDANEVVDSLTKPGNR